MVKLHYKDDSTFLKYLTMSLVGEVAAIEMMKAYGHSFVFDGYGAGTTEVFKEIFHKRKRTPDLICIACGQKLEVRAKSRLKIAMSHSSARPFDRELRAEDWVGFVRVVLRSPHLNETDPSSYRPPTEMYVISVAELSGKKDVALASIPKSKEMGLEKFLVWPTLLSPVTGNIKELTREPSRVHIAADGGNLVIAKPPAGSYLYNGIGIGSRVTAKETLICGIARTLRSSELRCPTRVLE